jgi:cysteine desulfurase
VNYILFKELAKRALITHYKYMKRIYLDYASLTPIDKRVMKEMKKYSSADYGNPSALYASAIKSKKAIADATKRIADVLHAHPDEIIFTSGGTESNQLVLEQFAPHEIVTSAIEHSSIPKTNAVAVNANGIIDLDDLKKKITSETKLVSIMYVNNETGAIQPIHEIVRLVRKINKNILVHTDAAQAGLLPLHVEKLGVDFMALDGNKIYGPRGVGMLYVRRGLKIERSGTENVPGIMGLARALEITEKIREKEYARLSELKKFFLDELKKKKPEIKVNGDIGTTSPHILNVSIPGIDNEFFVLKLDAKGIECSTKSACLFNSDESYVLSAMGADSKTSVRFSFGRQTTKSDLKKVLKNTIL